MAPPINFSFLFKAFFEQYFGVVLTIIFKFQINKVNIHNNIQKKYSNKFSKKPLIIFAIYFTTTK